MQSHVIPLIQDVSGWTLRRVGPQLDTERLVNVLEAMKNFDLGVGIKINFSDGDHQALHKIWGTQLDDKGHYKPINLE